MRTMRTGRHYPTPRFEQWRLTMAMYLVAAKARQRATWPICGPVRLVVSYVPGDHRTRDIAGMLDALGHLFEYVGLLENDGQIRAVDWRECPPSPDGMKLSFKLEPIEDE